jgi:CubicO group peptidase (beta-lactamase class C family)/predicted glycoside hydrolase/deacetylase ChbG (UPF0249 family)
MFKKLSLSLVSIFIIGQLAFAQNVNLQRSNPEAEGVSSKGIIDFLDAVESSEHEFHSIMILRHGKVIAEGWWKPYAPDLKHTMYSVSKSFTASAVGFAVAENLLSVEDKVTTFFPNDVPAEISPNLGNLKVKHLLSMSVGHDKDPTFEVVQKGDWVKAFLNTPVVYEPGTKFVYNSAATYMLGAIIEHVTGQTILEYLKPRLFQPLGISGMDWEKDPRGINTGGWGLRLKTEDMAKFGQLFLQKGTWGTKVILPPSWIEEATTTKIDQDPTASQSRKDSSDWLQGYCYQMWRSRHNSYRGDGAFGQYILVLPEQDAVIAITSETDDMQGELDLVWKHLLPAFQPSSLPDRKSTQVLKKRLLSLSVRPPVQVRNDTIIYTQAVIQGKTYTMVSGDRKLVSMRLDFLADGFANVTLNTDSAMYQFRLGSATWEVGETTKLGPYLVSGAQGNRRGLPPFKIAGRYGWVNGHTLDITLRYIDSEHTETIRCSFVNDEVRVDFINRFNRNTDRPLRRGIVKPAIVDGPRLIVRGDDMGFSHSANLALIKSYREGIETSIEVIVPSPWFPEAVKLLEQNPRVDVGLHFAITSEWDNVKWRPLTDCPSLRNEDGYFYPMLFPNRNYPKQAVMDNAWKIEDIEKELRAQIELALKYIPRLSHVSGHMYSTAFNPKVKEVARKLAQEYKLPMVDIEPEKELSLYYVGIRGRGKSIEEKIDAFVKMLNDLENGKIYVFVEHPGIDNEELRAISHIGYEDVAEGRQGVTTLWTHEKVKEALVRKGVSLVSYRDVLKVSK